MIETKQEKLADIIVNHSLKVQPQEKVLIITETTYPKDLEDFAIGYCLGEGLIKDFSDIESIKLELLGSIVFNSDLIPPALSELTP